MNPQPRIGAIVRCDATGLGIQSKEFFDHIDGCKALVIDMSRKSVENVHQQNHFWYPGQTIFSIQDDMKIPPEVIENFIKDIDVLVTFETAYDYNIFNICRQRGVKTILQLNYEFLEYPEPGHPAPDLFLAASTWHYDKVPEPKAYLPVPVNTFRPVPMRKERTFVHIAGILPTKDRNGTQIFLTALHHVKNEIQAIIRCQKHIEPVSMPAHINLTIDCTNKPNYADNYQGGVLVMPRKFGGLCLPCNEALAAEMPVIMPNIPPNNDWLPAEWLTDAKKLFWLMVKREVDFYEPDPVSLAGKIDEFCNREFYDAAIEKTRALKRQISWETLLPRYMELFQKMVNG